MDGHRDDRHARLKGNPADSGPRLGALRAGRAVARRGFETALRTTRGDKVARAVALDASGHVLGRSKAIRI